MEFYNFTTFFYSRVIGGRPLKGRVKKKVSGNEMLLVTGQNPVILFAKLQIITFGLF